MSYSQLFSTPSRRSTSTSLLTNQQQLDFSAFNDDDDDSPPPSPIHPPSGAIALAHEFTDPLQGTSQQQEQLVNIPGTYNFEPQSNERSLPSNRQQSTTASPSAMPLATPRSYTRNLPTTTTTTNLNQQQQSTSLRTRFLPWLVSSSSSSSSSVTAQATARQPRPATSSHSREGEGEGEGGALLFEHDGQDSDNDDDDDPDGAGAGAGGSLARQAARVSYPPSSLHQTHLPLPSRPPVFPSPSTTTTTTRSSPLIGIGGGQGNDGVFANLSAKPDGGRGSAGGEFVGGDDDFGQGGKEEVLPAYEVAALDSTPPYWETTVITPQGLLGPDDICVDGLPVGSPFSFAWNLLVSMSFQFVGFLLTYLLHTTHAAKNGARAGLGITLIQLGFYLKERVDHPELLDPSSPDATGLDGALGPNSNNGDPWSWWGGSNNNLADEVVTATATKVLGALPTQLGGGALSGVMEVSDPDLVVSATATATATATGMPSLMGQGVESVAMNQTALVFSFFFSFSSFLFFFLLSVGPFRSPHSNSLHFSCASPRLSREGEGEREGSDER
ncbi:hypothetical protein T439DRAFT_321294 [Meredithblackwellia eburnea MCA 4105]